MKMSGHGTSDMKGDSGLSINVSTAPTMTELNRSAATTLDTDVSGADGGGLLLDFSFRFVPYTTLSACCLLFNCIALAALCFVRGPRTVHHRLLANLTIGDVIGTILLWLYYNSPYIFAGFEPTGLRYCLFIVVILLVPVILSLCASSLALLLLAANQYLAICNPLFAQTRVSPGRAGLCIVVAWMTSATAAALPALLMLMLHYSDERRVCTNYTNSMANKSLEVCAYVLAALIIVSVLLYARIYREVLLCRRRANELRASVTRSTRSTVAASVAGRLTDNRHQNSAETNYKAFVTTLLLTGTLVVFWLPHMIFQLLSAHINPEHLPDAVILIKFYVIDFLPMLNFLTDPLIYGMRMREIRRAYRRLLVAVLPCSWCRRRLQTEQHQMSVMTDAGVSFTVVAMTSRIDSSSALERQTGRNLVDTEFSLHDE